jgi:hypothetical protein
MVELLWVVVLVAVLLLVAVKVAPIKRVTVYGCALRCLRPRRRRSVLFIGTGCIEVTGCNSFHPWL